ncbi:MAG: hypothetical protein SRB2_00753 [Desulfobacteraceae bacterium Eth-SRB2]|nr:MAG: hypothetical protein SRB2_00753 [Desulfobacteraceae bacterium Eth-SRB2]
MHVHFLQIESTKINNVMNKSRKITFFLLSPIADIVFISLFLYLSFCVGSRLLIDCDTGYHIRAGEYILNTFSIPKHDIFSFHAPPLQWTAHEWLSEVVMAMVHRAVGLTGIVVFFSFIISLVYYLLFKIIRMDRGNIILAAFIVLIVLTASQVHWFARPHIFSLLLLLIWYYLLDEYEYQRRNYLYLLPLLMLLWVNLHGGFLAGFILLGVYLSGNVVMSINSKGSEKYIYKKKARLIGLITVVCVLVSLINPYGYHILMFPFNLISKKFIMDNIAEFLSPDFHTFVVKAFEFLFLLFFTLLAVSKVRLNIIELTMVLLFAHMSFFSLRYIPLFSIIVAPVLMRKSQQILKSTNGKLADFIKIRSISISETDASAKGYVWPAMAVAIVVIFAVTGKIDYKFNVKTKPVNAVNFFTKENIQGNMFNNDEFGDYIIYAAWPKYKVFFDGRSDMYGVDRLKEYMKVARVEPGWDEVLEKYKINWIIYNANSPLSLLLMEKDDWKLIYADKVSNIFVKDNPRNQYLIEKYPDVELIIGEGTEDT